ncbi:MAG: hypothetical protein KY455_10285 [Euryarchaeota archaeon]|nr:hypothetical protein [Euryarchaeota archaeon]
MDGLAALRALPRSSLYTGLAWGTGYLLLTGLVTLLLPNTLFTRMTPISGWEYLMWPIAALMVGGFMAIREGIKTAGVGCSTSAGAGGVASFIGVSCPVCIHLFVALMGTGGVLTFVEPYRLHIGLVGLVLLVVALALVLRRYLMVAGQKGVPV